MGVGADISERSSTVVCVARKAPGRQPPVAIVTTVQLGEFYSSEWRRPGGSASVGWMALDIPRVPSTAVASSISKGNATSSPILDLLAASFENELRVSSGNRQECKNGFIQMESFTQMEP